jgi:hypothetical protein
VEWRRQSLAPRRRWEAGWRGGEERDVEGDDQPEADGARPDRVAGPAAILTALLSEHDSHESSFSQARERAAYADRRERCGLLLIEADESGCAGGGPINRRRNEPLGGNLRQAWNFSEDLWEIS